MDIVFYIYWTNRAFLGYIIIGVMVVQCTAAIVLFYYVVEPQLAALRKDQSQELVNYLRVLIKNGRAVNEFDFMIKAGANPTDLMLYLGFTYYLGPIFAVILFVSGIRSSIKGQSAAKRLEHQVTTTAINAQAEANKMARQMQVTASNLEHISGNIDLSMRQLSQIANMREQINVLTTLLNEIKTKFDLH